MDPFSTACYLVRPLPVATLQLRQAEVIAAHQHNVCKYCSPLINPMHLLVLDSRPQQFSPPSSAVRAEPPIWWQSRNGPAEHESRHVEVEQSAGNAHKRNHRNPREQWPQFVVL